MSNSVYDLMVCAIKNPLGIDILPSFSWKTKSDKANVVQSTYRIVVSKSEDFKNPVWDTGITESDDSHSIEYMGDELEPLTRYFYRVTLSDNYGEEYSSNAYFETGLMTKNPLDWCDNKGNKAKWIGADWSLPNNGAVLNYRMSLEFCAYDGVSEIAVNARNKDKYILFSIDTDNKKVKVFECNDNSWAGSYESGVRAYKNPFGNAEGYEIPENAISDEWNALEIIKNARFVTVKINGAVIIDNEEILEPEAPHHPYNNRLFMFGFKQDKTRADYRSLKIATDNDRVIVNEDFKNPDSKFSSLGTIEDGILKVCNHFGLVNFSPSIYLRKKTSVSDKIRSARLYATARGVYDVFINGKKVNKTFFNPGFTDYRKRIQYQTYDVTDYIENGENVIGAVVGNGYYRGFLGYNAMPMIYGEQVSYFSKLVITYESGKTDIVLTDETWEMSDNGAIIYDDFLNGEIYDARRELDFSDFNSQLWRPCALIAPPDEFASPSNGEMKTPVQFELSAQIEQGQIVEREIEGKYTGEAKKGHFVYDLGQNIVGTVRIKVKGTRGTEIKIRYGEMCYKNGEIYLSNLRTALNTDVYILKGGESEEYTPSFSFHGFRYIEISGCGEELKNNDIVLEVIGIAITNTDKVHGNFKCSNELVNKLFENIIWGQMDNSLMVYTDCPQRNERMGWTGDAQVFMRTAAYNMDVRAFTDKWLKDLRDAQILYNKNGAVPDTAPLGGDNRPDGCAAWADASVIVPWEIYRAYGDKKVLEENYEMMKAWVEYQTRPERQNYGVRTVDGCEVPEQSDLSSIPFIQTQQSRGDHLTFDESTPFILSATAYAARVSQFLAMAAGELGKAADALKYTNRYKNIKRAFNEAWVKDDGSIAYWGEMSKGGINKTYYAEGTDNPPSQTAYVLALKFGLISDEKIPAAANYLCKAIERFNGCLSTGFLGVSHINPVLTKAGHEDVAYSLLLQDKNPSWLYSVINGATTIWERWNSYIAETDTFGDIAMNSFNHYAYGAVGEWMFESVLGIQPIKPGYKEIRIRPKISDKLSYASGYHESPYGKIKSEWKINDGKIKFSGYIPPNTTAVVCIADKEYIVGSGNFEFEV